MTPDVGDRAAGRRWAAVPLTSLLVPAVAAVGAVAFLAWKPGVARSMLGSPRALGFTAVVTGLVVGLGWLLPRLGRGARVTAAVQAVPVVLAFAFTVLPAFRDVSADDPFPLTATAHDPTSTSTTPPDGDPTPSVAQAAIVTRAPLRGIDHRASGDVVLLVLSDGRRLVRFESLDVEPGPDYQVHLVPGAGRHSPDGGAHLGRLRANRGNLNYPVPSGQVIHRPVTVLVWCRAFAVPVAAATIR